MTASEAIERFEIAVASGKVANVRTGELCPTSPSTANSIISSVAAAFRHAAGKSDLDSINYEAFADDLDRYAREDAECRGLSDANSRAARCRRFVLTLDGGTPPRRRRTGPDALPRGWTPYYVQLRDAELEHGSRARRAGALIPLASACAARGIRSPADVPDANVLREWLKDDGLSADKAQNALSAFRALRELVGPEELPDIDRCPVLHERGLRSLPDIVERLEAAGYRGAVNALSSEEVLALLAPRFHRETKAFVDSKAGTRAADWPKKVWGMASRIVAQVVRTAGAGESFSDLHPTSLYVAKVEVEDAIDEQALEGEEWIFEHLDEEPDEVKQPRRDVYRFRLLALGMAVQSAENSPLSAHAADPVEGGAPFFTTCVQEDVRLFGQLADHAGAPLFKRNRQIGTHAADALRAFRKEMRDANKNVYLEGRKNKEKLLELVTFPMLICVGIPWLRSRVHEMRSRWEEAILRHGGDVEHPAVLRRERSYDRLLMKYLVFSTVTADGLRIQNYAGGRLGSTRLDRMSECRAPCGTLVRSFGHVEPVFGDEGLRSILTNFRGGDAKRVKLKVARRANDGTWRQRPHWLRPSVVDLGLFEDHLVRVRPKGLAEQGLIASAGAYDLEEDLRQHGFALFVSDVRSSRPYLAVTGGYGATRLSEIYGEVLHLICTQALGRDLPPFGTPELRREYRGLFSAHVSRLLAATYLYGIRGRLDETRTLIDDTAAVIDKRYSVVEASMVHKRGWEQPHFFDEVFDRIWDDEEILGLEVIRKWAELPPEQLPPALR